MPTATSFTALGRGNGFPFCLDRLDISSFSHWVTLGGYQKTNADAGTSVTQNQINLSFANAMKLFWNAYRFNINIEVVGTNGAVGGSGTVTETFTKDFFETDSSTITTVSPRERVCFASSSSLGSDLDEVSSGFYNSFATWDISIKRYYNGSAGSENNFIGYGLGGLIFKSVLKGFSRTPPDRLSRVRAISEYRLHSITPEQPGRTNDEVGYTTISGIPLVYGVAASASTAPSGEPGSTVNIGSNGAISLAPYFGVSSKVINPSIDFYTYT